VERVLHVLGAGDIVLLHDVSPAAAPEQAPAVIEALPAILDGLEKRGLQAVTVSELLGEPAYLDDRKAGERAVVPRRGLLAKAVAATLALLVLAAGASALAGPTESNNDGEQEWVKDFPASFVAAASMLSEHSSVQARFTQRKSSKLFVDEVVQRGLLQLRRHDRRLLWSYDEGARLLLADGQFYSLGAPDAAGGARRLPPVVARMAEMMGALFFLRLEVLVDHFEVSDAGKGLFVLHSRRAVPKAAFRAVRLQLGGEPLALQQVVLEENGGDVTRIEFADVQLGKQLPEGLFLLPGEGTVKP
jgi:outer membrane lipoprotein-sorting protein